jgi:hypothetical protein
MSKSVQRSAFPAASPSIAGIQNCAFWVKAVGGPCCCVMCPLY